MCEGGERQQRPAENVHLQKRQLCVKLSTTIPHFIISLFFFDSNEISLYVQDTKHKSYYFIVFNQMVNFQLSHRCEELRTLQIAFNGVVSVFQKKCKFVKPQQIALFHKTSVTFFFLSFFFKFCWTKVHFVGPLIAPVLDFV